MTHEEAINDLNTIKDFFEQQNGAYPVSLEYAISVLKNDAERVIGYDLIKRENAIRTVCECECYSGDNPCKEGKGCYAVNELRKLPSADRTQWIPCSERLPEDIRPVLVTWKNTDPASYYQYIVDKHFIGTAHYHRGKWYWYSSVTEDLLAEYGKCDGEEFDEAIEAVAWMPLPKPWKGADDE